MFASRVLPGAALVRATRCRSSALIRLDLPTFERPTMATSGRPSAGKSAAPAALVMNSAVIFNQTAGGAGGAGRPGWVTTRPSSPSRLSSLSCPLVSNGVVDDGAVDRFGLSTRAQTAGQRFGQRDFQDLVHRLDHVDVQRVQHVFRNVRQILLVVFR